jgi:hypothetical protein
MLLHGDSDSVGPIIGAGNRVCYGHDQRHSTSCGYTGGDLHIDLIEAREGWCQSREDDWCVYTTDCRRYFGSRLVDRGQGRRGAVRGSSFAIRAGYRSEPRRENREILRPALHWPQPITLRPRQQCRACDLCDCLTGSRCVRSVNSGLILRHDNRGRHRPGRSARDHQLLRSIGVQILRNQSIHLPRTCIRQRQGLVTQQHLCVVERCWQGAVVAAGMPVPASLMP